MKLSLVIPCFNERQSLGDLIDRCKPLVSDRGVEVIFVDNGSTDGTGELLSELTLGEKNFRCVTVTTNIGYGHGIVEGLRAATGDILAWTHADLQTDPRDIRSALNFYSELDDQFFVKGSRKGRPLLDVLFTFGMSIFESLLFMRLLWDINAQPTVFPRKFFDTWSNPPQDFSLDLYAYVMAKKTGLRVKRFPVIFSARTFGISHWNTDFRNRIKFILRTLSFSFSLRKGLRK